MISLDRNAQHLHEDVCLRLIRAADVRRCETCAFWIVTQRRNVTRDSWAGFRVRLLTDSLWFKDPNGKTPRTDGWTDWTALNGNEVKARVVSLRCSDVSVLESFDTFYLPLSIFLRLLNTFGLNFGWFKKMLRCCKNRCLRVFVKKQAGRLFALCLIHVHRYSNMLTPKFWFSKYQV